MTEYYSSDTNPITRVDGGMSSLSPAGHRSGEIGNEWLENTYNDSCPISSCDILNQGCTTSDLKYQVLESQYYCTTAELTNANDDHPPSGFAGIVLPALHDASSTASISQALTALPVQRSGW